MRPINGEILPTLYLGYTWEMYATAINYLNQKLYQNLTHTSNSNLSEINKATKYNNYYFNDYHTYHHKQYRSSLS